MEKRLFPNISRKQTLHMDMSRETASETRLETALEPEDEAAGGMGMGGGAGSEAGQAPGTGCGTADFRAGDRDYWTSPSHLHVRTAWGKVRGAVGGVKLEMESRMQAVPLASEIPEVISLTNIQSK